MKQGKLCVIFIPIILVAGLAVSGAVYLNMPLTRGLAREPMGRYIIDTGDWKNVRHWSFGISQDNGIY